MSEAADIPPSVLDVFAQSAPDVQARLQELRRLIFEVAAADDRIGPVSESLKWGQPSYSTAKGTPLRLGVAKTGEPALFAHCQSLVISDARLHFGNRMVFEGNRAVLLPMETVLPEAELRQVILSALTYRLAKRS